MGVLVGAGRFIVTAARGFRTVRSQPAAEGVGRRCADDGQVTEPGPRLSGRRRQSTGPRLERSPATLLVVEECQIRQHVVSDELLVLRIQSRQFVHAPPRTRVEVDLLDGSLLGMVRDVERHNFVVVGVSVHKKAGGSILEIR